MQRQQIDKEKKGNISDGNNYTYIYGSDKCLKRHIKIDRELKDSENEELSKILLTFPHSSNSLMTVKFLQENYTHFSKELLMIAANAYDSNGNTMLGVAADDGNAEAVQQLINLGAKVNKLDAGRKPALHWAICNKLSVKAKISYKAAEVVRCLLFNRALTDIKLLKFAQNNGFKAAADLIMRKEEAPLIGGLNGIFNKLPIELNEHLASFLIPSDCEDIIFTRKEAYQESKLEVEKFSVSIRRAL